MGGDLADSLAAVLLCSSEIFFTQTNLVHQSLEL